MAAASLHSPHRRLHRKEWQIARVENPRGSRHSLARWQRALRAQAPDDCGTDTQRQRSLRAGQPVGRLWEVGEARRRPHTRDPGRPPGFPGPGTLAQAMPRGRAGLGATALGECTAHRQRRRRGRAAVLPHGMPRPPPRWVHPAVPGARPQGRGGRGERIDDQLLQPRAPQTLFERC
jgi:hypothetical protein